MQKVASKRMMQDIFVLLAFVATKCYNPHKEHSFYMAFNATTEVKRKAIT